MSQQESRLNTNFLFSLTLILTTIILAVILSYIDAIPKRGIIGFSIFYPILPIIAVLLYSNVINLRQMLGTFLIILVLASGVRLPFLGQVLYPITFYAIYAIGMGFIILWHSILKNSYKELQDSKIIIIPFALLIIGALLSIPFVKDTKNLIIWFYYALVNISCALVFVYSFQTYDDIMKIGIPTYTIVATLFISTVFIKPPEYTYSGMIQRYAGIFATPNAPGVFGAFSLFLALAAIFYVKKRIIKIFYGIVIIVYLIAIIRTASRNAFFGSIVGFWVFQALLIYRYRRKRLLFIFSTLFTGAITLLLAYIAIKHSKTLLLRVSVSTKGDLSILTRFFFWNSVLHYIINNPIHSIIGVGPIQFYHYPFSLNYAYPHNVVVDFLFSFGIFGLLALGVLLFYQLKAAFKVIKKVGETNINTYIVKIAVISSLVVFWITSLFDEIPWKVKQVEIIYLIVPYLITTLKILTHKND